MCVLILPALAIKCVLLSSIGTGIRIITTVLLKKRSMDCVVGFSNLKRALPEDLQQFIQGAHDQLWSFAPEPWRPKNGTLPPELFHNFSEINLYLPNFTNYQVAKECIKKAIEEKLYQEAMDILFIVDRYAYWMDNSETPELLDEIQQIVNDCPEVAVAPQLILRRVRLLKDRGDYQSADEICVSLLSQAANCVDNEDLRIGTWSFRTRRDFLLTVSVFLMLRGIIQMYLAQPVDATIYLAASCQLTASATPDGRSYPQSLQMFTDIFLDMASSEREELQSVVTVNNSEIPLAQYLRENAFHILDALPPGDLHFLKQIRRLTRIALQQLTESTVEDIPDDLLHLLKSSIPENLEWAIPLQYQEIAHDYATSVFNVHLAFNHFGHPSEDILVLSKRLFMKSCGSSSEEALAYFKKELAKTRARISDLLTSVETDGSEKPEHESRYPVLRDSSPIDLLRDFKHPAMPSKCLTNSPLAENKPEDTDGPKTVDPVATTFARSGLLPSNMRKFDPKLFQSNDSHTSDAALVGVEDCEELVYRSLVKLPAMAVDGFSAPQKLHAVSRNQEGMYASSGSNGEAPSESSAESGETISRVLQTNLIRDTVYRANVARYYPSEDQWRYQKTLVFIHGELQLTKRKKGQLRDVIKLQYLHQGDFKAMYVGKLYREKKLPKTYHDDVIVHQLALQCVSRFNKKLQPCPKFANRIRMVPVVHMEILDETDRILEVLNVEPFIHGSFTKMTNNLDKVNSDVDLQSLLAFSHFTWCDSDGKFMVTDLQGWIPDDPRIAVILTDPAINSDHLDCLGLTNMGSKGFRAFWTKQHPTCNEICQLLKLERDSNHS